MKSQRPLSINNSLAHGICNYNCRMCAVNKPGYSGPTEFQPHDVTARLISEVTAAGGRGTYVRYIANSGDGEPTLHPDFSGRMDMFGDMIREWDAPVPAPEVALVTNGSHLTRSGVLEAVARNRLALIVSFPTANPAHYGAIVAGQPACGHELLARVLGGVRRAMRLASEGKIHRLCFHLSPPEREIIRGDFPGTADLLCSMAASAGLKHLEMVLFPATSNRSGLVRNSVRKVDLYRDLLRRYDRSMNSGVELRLELSFKRFFPRTAEILDLLRSFSMPCMWNAHMFITAAGDSICCNDQAVRDPMGNIRSSTIEELMRAKEQHTPGPACAGCDQRPERMRGNAMIRCFAAAASLRMAWSRMRSKPAGAPSSTTTCPGARR